MSSISRTSGVQNLKKQSGTRPAELTDNEMSVSPEAPYTPGPTEVNGLSNAERNNRIKYRCGGMPN